MEQLAAGEVSLVAQVEVFGRDFGGGRQAQAALLGLQVARQGDGWRVLRDGAHPLANFQLVADQRQACGVAVAEHGQGRLAHLGQTGHRQIAQGRQRRDQPHGLDDAGGGDIQPLGAQRPRGANQPAGRRAIGRVP